MPGFKFIFNDMMVNIYLSKEPAEISICGRMTPYVRPYTALLYSTCIRARMRYNAASHEQDAPYRICVPLKKYGLILTPGRTSMDARFPKCRAHSGLFNAQVTGTLPWEGPSRVPTHWPYPSRSFCKGVNCKSYA